MKQVFKIVIAMSIVDEIYAEHKAIGFPPLSEEDQLKLIYTHDVEIINKLTPGFEARFVPINLFKKYITINKDVFKNFFIKSSYVESQNKAHAERPNHDGHWVEKTKKGSYIFYNQERGRIDDMKKFNSLDEVHDYFVDWFFLNLK